MSPADSPLTGPPPAEVPLSDAPLVRVIAQVRFPLIAAIEGRELVAPFQEAIRKAYPVLRPEQSRNVVFGPNGVMDTRSNTLWRFHHPDSAWRLTLAPDFIALETTDYTSRDDFMERLRVVLSALKERIDPQVVDRIGVRYVDRISGENLDDLDALIRPQVSGILSTPLRELVRHAISENVFDLPDGAGRVTARWGLMPAKGTVDPAAVEPIDEESWLLDIDAFQAEEQPFDIEAVVGQARAFAERIYTIFRWTVTDEFLRRYGGNP